MPTFVPELDRAQIVEATRHTHAIWSSGRALDDHSAHTLHQLDLAGPELFQYAGLVDETGLVASMKRYWLAASGPDGRAIPALGIGAVYTREDARGRGFASRLLREALRDARARGARAAWLHAEIDPGFYARLGFVGLPAFAWTAPAAELPASGALSIRPAAPGDIERMLAWHDEGFGGRPWLRPVRSPAMWRFFTFRNQVSACILSDAGHDVGYLASSSDSTTGKLWVDEWSAPGIPLDRIRATLRAVSERDGLAVVTGWLRPDHAGPPFEPSPRPAGIPMIAPLEANWTAASIDPERAHFGSFDYF